MVSTNYHMLTIQQMLTTPQGKHNSQRFSFSGGIVPLCFCQHPRHEHDWPLNTINDLRYNSANTFVTEVSSQNKRLTIHR